MNTLIAMLRGLSTVTGALLGLAVSGFALFLMGRGRMAHFLLGLLRAWLVYFIAPFGHLRRLAVQVADFGERPGDLRTHPTLFLLERFLVYSQAAILVVACVILATGTAKTWDTLRPDPSLLEARRDARSELGTARAELAAKEAEAQTAEATSPQRLAAALSQFREPRQRIADQANSEMLRLAGELRSNPETQVLLEFLETEIGKESPGNDDQIAWLHSRLRNRMERANWAGGSSQSLLQWLDAWRKKADAEIELAGAESKVRADQERKDSRLPGEVQRLRERVGPLEDRLAQIEKELSPHWIAASIALLGTLGSLLLFVWIAGLLLELFGSWIRLAGDVRDLRARLAGEAAQHRSTD